MTDMHLTEAVAAAVRAVDPNATAVRVVSRARNVVVRDERVEFQSAAEAARAEAIAQRLSGWSLPVYGRTKKNLTAAGIETFGDVDRVGIEVVRAIRGVGPKTIAAIETARTVYTAVIDATL